MNSKVSIIIPAYNCGNYIVSSVKTLLEQSYKNIEIIIVNDGSTDDTEEKIKLLISKEPSIILISQENSGVSEARNVGIAVSTGKYIMFMDADDEVERDWVKNLIGIMEKGDSELAVCGFLVKSRDSGETNSISKLSDCSVRRDEFIDRIFRHRDVLPAIWNKIYITDIIKENNIKFDKKYTIGEDLLFLLEYCIHIKKAYIISDMLYIYYINEAGAMQAHNTKKSFNNKWLTEWYTIKEAEKILLKNNIPSKSITVKKVRIADKLISIIQKYNTDIPEKKELLAFLRKNGIKVIVQKEFGVKKKLSIILNCLSPKIKYNINSEDNYK